MTTLLETVEGEYAVEALPPEDWIAEDGRIPIATVRSRPRRGRKSAHLGRVFHEELSYRPNDGLSGVVQRYFFTFERDLDLDGREVFHRHHLPESRWRELGEVRAHFEAAEDNIVLCEVTQFNLRTFRPALRRLGMSHTDAQVQVLKSGNMRPYAILAFSPR